LVPCLQPKLEKVKFRVNFRSIIDILSYFLLAFLLFNMASGKASHLNVVGLWNH